MSIFPHKGPDRYTPVTISSPLANPVAGGDLVYGSEAGMKLFDMVLGSLSDSGVYRVHSIPVSRSDNPQGSQQPTYRLQWCYADDGLEVVDGTYLGGECVRLIAFGIE
jgi:hypothetical protein